MSHLKRWALLVLILKEIVPKDNQAARRHLNNFEKDVESEIEMKNAVDRGYKDAKNKV